MRKKTFLEKITLLNGTAPYIVAEEDLALVIKKFTETCIEIFEADFGFAFRKSSHDKDAKLVYSSLKAPKNSKSVAKDKQLVIPIRYGDHVHGQVVLGYKKAPNLTQEEMALTEMAGSILAQAITINWLVEKEWKNLALAEKQKEIQVLLDQEKLKTEFIANATHELRTPLAIMKGNVDLALLNKGDLRTTSESLKATGEEINILSEILKDLAMLTSSEQNVKQMMNFSPVSITKIVDRAAKRLKTVALKKNISVETKTGEKRGLLVEGDEQYLEKLFLNLIKNAVTYGTDNGNILIEITKEKKTAVVKVIDNGIGISKEDVDKIFDRFYQGDKAHSSHGTHSGLGLAIAKWVAEAHRGTINVKSTPGKGSTFTVSLPLAKDA